MATRRDAVLDGVLEAARLHKELRTVDTLDASGERVDVFEAILLQGVELLFRRLEGLLGAFLPSHLPGILITTERPLSIQRLTAAHELGHLVLKHRGALDREEILHRSPMSDQYDIREIAADAFAAAFLMPAWLVEHHAQRQGWAARDLSSPAVIYQLALRLGTSYEATARTLHQHQMINGSTLKALLNVTPKSIKQNMIGQSTLERWHPNVWLFTERDNGATILGEASDVFVFRLREHCTSGYLWNVLDAVPPQLATLSDERRVHEEEVGGIVERVVTLRAEDSIVGHLNLHETRPWLPNEPLNSLSVAYDLRGREQGLPRSARERIDAA